MINNKISVTKIGLHHHGQVNKGHYSSMVSRDKPKKTSQHW